ncbi:hypothetical protein BDW69DRAFT_183539 [Aspergillus filifer]
MVGAYEAGDVILHSPFMIHAGAMNESRTGCIRVSTGLQDRSPLMSGGQSQPTATRILTSLAGRPRGPTSNIEGIGYLDVTPGAELGPTCLSNHEQEGIITILNLAVV